MLTRILTAVLLAPLVVWLFLGGPDSLRASVLIGAALLCLHELGAMAFPTRRADRVALLFAGAAPLVGLVARGGHDGPVDYAVALILPAAAVLARPLPIEGAGPRLLAAWAAIIYITLPMSYAIQLASRTEPWLIYVLTTVWAGDTLAYFAGRAFGRHPLHPAVSPKKTIEGAVGGLVGSAAGGVGVVVLLGLPMGLLPAIGVSLLAGLVAQMGDLAESVLKRSAGVKDSGAILPGHGGMLDRIDGVLFALPVCAAFILP
jgi:phosphatidate cytidylyltransferase